MIEFVRFVASILKMRFTFYLIAQNIHQLETTFFNKIANRIPNYKHIPISTLIIELMNSTDYYLNKQLVQYVTSCLEMRDNLLSEAWYCYLIYFSLLLLLKCFCNAEMAMQIKLIVVVATGLHAVYFSWAVINWLHFYFVSSFCRLHKIHRVFPVQPRQHKGFATNKDAFDGRARK